MGKQDLIETKLPDVGTQAQLHWGARIIAPSRFLPYPRKHRDCPCAAMEPTQGPVWLIWKTEQQLADSASTLLETVRVGPRR